MSFSNAIRYKLIIGKLFGILYFPCDFTHKKSTVIDYLCPIPLMITYGLTIYTEISTKTTNWLDLNEEYVYAMDFLIVVCICCTIIKWIYFIKTNSDFHKLLIDIDNFIAESRYDLDSTRSKGNCFIILISLYLVSDIVFNFHIQLNFFHYFVVMLPYYMAFYEQCLIHAITDELHILFKRINSNFCVQFASNRNDTGQMLNKLKRVYRNEKILMKLAQQANDIFGLWVLFEIGITLLGITGAIYMYPMKSWIWYFYYMNASETSTMCVRLYYTVYNWERLTVQANKTLSMIHAMWNRHVKRICNRPDLRDWLRFITLDLSINKLQFTVCNLLPLNWTILYMIIGSVASYTIILGQFHQMLKKKADHC